MTRVCPCREVWTSPQLSLHEYRSTRWLLWTQMFSSFQDQIFLNIFVTVSSRTHRGSEDVGLWFVRVPLDRPHVPFTLTADFPRRFRRSLEVHHVEETTPGRTKNNKTGGTKKLKKAVYVIELSAAVIFSLSRLFGLFVISNKELFYFLIKIMSGSESSTKTTTEKIFWQHFFHEFQFLSCSGSGINDDSRLNLPLDAG